MNDIVKDLNSTDIIVQQDKDRSILDGEVYMKIVKQRMLIKSHPSFHKTLFELKSYLQETHRIYNFIAQSQEQSDNKDITISSQEVKKSSQDASIICLSQEKINRLAITVYFFKCKIDELKAYMHNC